jgi:hypothetical protein
VRLDVQGDHRFDRDTALGIWSASVREVFGQCSSLVADPGLKRGDKLRLVDEPNL